jgi:hypothetical protein
LIYQIWLAYLCFKAVINACDTIWRYYEVKYGDRTFSLSNQTCIDAEALHTFWMIVNGILLLLRLISLYYMLKGFAYLVRRAEEKQRRIQRQMLKNKRLNERRRNELERKIAKKKKEQRDVMLRERRMIDEDQIRIEEKRMIQAEEDK